MARNRETKIELTAYDDLFQTDESRAEAALSKIRDIPLSEIDEFPDHPFKVLMDEDSIRFVSCIFGSDYMDERPYEQCDRIDLQSKDIFNQTGAFKIFSRHHYGFDSCFAVKY